MSSGPIFGGFKNDFFKENCSALKIIFNFIFFLIYNITLDTGSGHNSGSQCNVFRSTTLVCVMHCIESHALTDWLCLAMSCWVRICSVTSSCMVERYCSRYFLSEHNNRPSVNHKAIHQSVCCKINLHYRFGKNTFPIDQQKH